MGIFRFATLLWMLAFVGAGEIAAAEPVPTFSRDIVPMFTKLGCNTTECHNVLKGKGGLKLSPLGSDARRDFDALARADSGRRVSRIDPANSLLLKRLSGPMSTVKLKPGTEGYRLFHEWMAAGARGPDSSDPHVVELTPSVSRVVLRKGDSTSIHVKARWSDGISKDVTRWCRFEISNEGEEFSSISDLGRITALEPGRSIIRIRYLKKVTAVNVLVGLELDQQDWNWQANNVVDEIVSKTWREVGVAPAKPAAEHRFLRRAWLQVLGRIPDEDSARKFLSSTRPARRSELIAEFLARPEFASHWAERWTEWLLEDRRIGWQSIPRHLHEKGDRERLQAWVQEKLEGHQPVPTIVRGVLTATGSPGDNGAAAFYTGHRTHQDMARSFGQVFLGVSMRCARCHDHPHGEWGTDDFFGLAAAFKDISIRKEKDRPWRVLATPVTSFQNPRTKTAVSPHVFGTPLENDGQDLRRALADWLPGDGQMLLARNIVHRHWVHFFKQPLTDWVDDLTPSSAERHPGLLDALARDLIEHDFDTRPLIRTLCESRVYQLDSPRSHKDDWFGSRFSIARQSTFQTFRSIQIAADSRLGNFDELTRRPGSALTESDVDCSRKQYRSYGGLISYLHMIGSNNLMAVIRDPNGIVARLVASDAGLEEITRRLYFRILHREPTEEEWNALAKYLRTASAEDRKRAELIEDIFWALVNSREFVLIE